MHPSSSTHRPWEIHVTSTTAGLRCLVYKSSSTIKFQLPDPLESTSIPVHSLFTKVSTSWRIFWVTRCFFATLLLSTAYYYYAQNTPWLQQVHAVFPLLSHLSLLPWLCFPLLVYLLLPRRVIGEGLEVTQTTGLVCSVLYEDGSVITRPPLPLSRISAVVLNEGIAQCGIHYYLAVVVNREDGKEGVEGTLFLPLLHSKPRLRELVILLKGLKQATADKKQS